MGPGEAMGAGADGRGAGSLGLARALGFTDVEGRAAPGRRGAVPALARVGWVDGAKGWCILLVVLLHSGAGVEAALGAEGWLGALSAWARPFRMPDFFLIAGLFVAPALALPWRAFLERKALPLLVVFALWLPVHLLARQGGLLLGDPAGFARAAVAAVLQPTAVLWFVVALALFLVLARLLRRVPAPLVLGAAAALEVGWPGTGWLLADETAARFVYFYAGLRFAPAVFRFAEAAAARPRAALAGLVAWAALNGALVLAPAPSWSGAGNEAGTLAGAGGVSLALGFAGALAVVAAAALLERLRARAGFGWVGALAWIGARSLPIYMAFTLPMAAARVALLRAGAPLDPGTMGLLVAVAALGGALLLAQLARGTPLEAMTARPRVRLPALTRLSPAGAPWPPAP